MSDLQAAYDSTLARIDMALEKANRPAKSAQLLAVSKKKTASMIQELAGLGQRAFGENYASEASEKIETLAGLDLDWHFIGPIQSNKTRLIAECFDWVHSIDRLKLVERLNAQRPANKPALNVLIQVNLDNEPQKAGCLPEDIDVLANAVEACDRLELRGLMAIPASRDGYAEQLAVFSELKRHYDALQMNHPQIDTLSAGMSDDLEAAIAAGATMVRIGSALFGKRV